MRDARVRERAAQRLAPQHAVHPQVGGERELVPWVFAGASGRNTLSPTPGARRLRVKVDGRLGAGMDPLPPVLGGTQRRSGRSRCSGTDCRRSPRASPARWPRTLRSSRSWMRDDHAGDAEAALHGSLLDECPLDVGQLALRARPSTVRMSLPTASAARTQQVATSRPSSNAEQEPHSPCSQAFLLPGSPSRSRRA